MKKALINITFNGSMNLIGMALANKFNLMKNNRIFISQGITNQFILKHLNVDTANHLKGYIDKTGLHSNKENQGLYVIEDRQISFMSNYDFFSNTFISSDIVVKGANALYFDGDKYSASVLSSSPNLGTYGNVYMKAIASSSEVIIPISIDKLINTKQFYTHTDINYFMGDFSSILLPMFYGAIFTEFEALFETFSLKAEMVAKGGINAENFSKVFLVHGDIQNIERVIEFLRQYN